MEEGEVDEEGEAEAETDWRGRERRRLRRRKHKETAAGNGAKEREPTQRHAGEVLRYRGKCCLARDTPGGSPEGLMRAEVVLQQSQRLGLPEDAAQGLVLSAKADAGEAVPLPEVDGRRRDARLYPDHAAVHFWRGPEIVAAHLPAPSSSPLEAQRSSQITAPLDHSIR